jgi:cyclic pyranopterin phosphate synthase
MQKQLFDQFQRRITYVRLSVTDRCNYRCTYCMPAEGLRILGKYDLLTFEELALISKVLVGEGIQKIRLTGGEPLLRKDLHVLAKKISSLDGLKELCLTTNGHLLGDQIEQLAEAGINRINVSIDSLNPEKFKQITRGGTLHVVLNGLKRSEEIMPGSIKINVVASKNFNDDEVLDFARMTIDQGYTVRFIEQMPLTELAKWERGEVLSVIDIRSQIKCAFGLEPVENDNGLNGPASYYRIPGAKGELGFIGAVTDDFCTRCNRIRITPDGKLRGCLMADGELDLKMAIRNSENEEDAERAVRAILFETMRTKPEKHYINDIQFIRPERSMSQIGG